MNKLLAVVSFALFCLLASPAAAQDDVRPCQGDGSSIVAWSVSGFEFGMAASLALRFTQTIDPETDTGGEAILQLMPWVTGLAGGFSAWCLELDYRPATAIHAALWTGFDMFLLGAIIDRAGTGGELGTTTAVLTTVGALAGGVFGATAVGDGNDGSWAWFFGGPPAGAGLGLVAEVIFLLVDVLGSDGRNFEKGFVPIAFGAVTLSCA